MNTGHRAGAQFGLEARARAAVLATADEIRPDDVPPAPPWLAAELLDGPLGRGDGARRDDRAVRDHRYGPGRGGRWHRAGHNWTGQNWAGRWGAPLAAAAAVVMAAGVTAALTVNRVDQRTGVTAGASSPTAPPSVSAAAAAAKREAASAQAAASAAAAAERARVPSPAGLQAGLIGMFVPASGAQHSAGAALEGQYQALENQVTAGCMAKAGFRFVPVTPGPAAGQGADLARYPDLDAIARAGALPGGGVSAPANPAGSAAFLTALKRCGAASGALLRGMMAAGLKLGGPFADTVMKIQDSAPVLATVPALRACAARYGWPGSGSGQPINSFDDFATWVSGQLAGARGLEMSQAAGQKVNAWWASAFVQCARPTVTVMEKLQLAAQQAYLASHKEQFAGLVAAAAAEFARAAQAARG